MFDKGKYFSLEHAQSKPFLNIFDTRFLTLKKNRFCPTVKACLMLSVILYYIYRVKVQKFHEHVPVQFHSSTQKQYSQYNIRLRRQLGASLCLISNSIMSKKICCTCTQKKIRNPKLTFVEIHRSSGQQLKALLNLVLSCQWEKKLPMILGH